jgi:hypothetical protein
VALHNFATFIEIQVFHFSYQVQHIIYGNLEVFYFFQFFIIFYYFFTNLKGDPPAVIGLSPAKLTKCAGGNEVSLPGGVGAGKIVYYPWRIRKGAPGVSPLSPVHRASVRRR